VVIAAAGLILPHVAAAPVLVPFAIALLAGVAKSGST
jgi:hypothetical protein